MIAVTFALPDESTVFLKTISNLRISRSGSLPLYFGTLGKEEIAVLHTGVGEYSARDRIQSFLVDHRPHFLISSGFVGGLDPDLALGAVLVATNYSTPALCASARSFFETDPSVYFGDLTTQSVPAESLAAKQSLFLETTALGVDMETAALAQACAEASILFLSLRAISDTARQPLPVPFSAWFDPMSQKARPLALLAYLSAHPGVIPEFVRFVRGVFQSKKIMAAHLLALIGFLSKSGFVHISD